MSKERGPKTINFKKGTGKFQYQVLFILSGIGAAYFLISPLVILIQANPKLEDMVFKAIIGIVIIRLVLGSIFDSFKTIRDEQIVELNMKKPKRPNWTKLTGTSSFRPNFKELGKGNDSEKITITPAASSIALSNGSLSSSITPQAPALPMKSTSKNNQKYENDEENDEDDDANDSDKKDST